MYFLQLRVTPTQIFLHFIVVFVFLCLQFVWLVLQGAASASAMPCRPHVYLGVKSPGSVRPLFRNLSDFIRREAYRLCILTTVKPAQYNGSVLGYTKKVQWNCCLGT